MRVVFVRLAGFVGLPLISLVTPFVLLPIMARISGAEGWSSVVAGQAVGAFGATVIAWGWGLKGPVEVAQNPDQSFRAELYRESLRSRLALALIVFPVVSVISATIATPEMRLDAVAMSWTTAIAGLSPSWFCIGVGRPVLLALYDTAPRVLATLLAVPIILYTREISLYAPLLVGAVVVSLIAFHFRIVPEGVGTFSQWGRTRITLKEQFSSAVISASGASYAATPVPIAQSFTAPAAAAGFGSADTIYRLGLFSVMALGNAFQGWTLEKDLSSSRMRHRTAVIAHGLLGICGGLFLTLLGPFISEILFGTAVRAPFLTCLFFGVSFLFISASSPFIRNILIPAGRQRFVLSWTFISAVIGVSSMIMAGLAEWSPGIALGMAVSEMVLFFATLIAGIIVYRRG